MRIFFGYFFFVGGCGGVVMLRVGYIIVCVIDEVVVWFDVIVYVCLYIYFIVFGGFGGFIRDWFGVN